MCIRDSNTALGEPVFAFDVEAYDRDGNVVFSDIASIRFDSTGAKSVVIDNIPAGSRVIVKAVSYTHLTSIIMTHLFAIVEMSHRRLTRLPVNQ